jgi:hypothetical protein
MIVSRKSAEGFLGKKLKSLGDIEAGKKRRASYYVLSSDGTKNLGGPYTEMDAKKRLRQVEFFKRNPESTQLMPYHERRRFWVKSTKGPRGTQAWILDLDNDKEIAGPFFDIDEAKDALVMAVAPPLTRDEHAAIEKLMKLLSRQGMDPQFKMYSVSGSSNGLEGSVSVYMDPSLFWGREAKGIDGAKKLLEPTIVDAGINAKLFPKISLHKVRNGIELRMDTGTRKLHRYPYYKELMLQPPSENPASKFHQRDHAWDEVLIQRGAKKLTRKQILDYYKKNTRNIWPYLKGQTVLVILAPSKNRFVLRRKRPSDDRHIKLTKLKGIDDESSFEYWIHRRAVEFHPVLTGKMTPMLWLDLDMHTTKSAPERARLLEKMKKAGPKIKRAFRKFGVSRIFSYESGKGGGLHFEGDLRKRHNVDKLRMDFTAALREAFEDDPVFTTAPAKSGQIRFDMSTFHTLGSLRAPFSMTVTGHPKKRISL